MNAPKHTSAKPIVSVDTVFSLTPRTRFSAAAACTIASFGDAVLNCTEVATLRGFLFADAILDIISLHSPRQVPVAANATTASPAAWGAIPGRICDAVAQRALKFPCDNSPARFRSP